MIHCRQCRKFFEHSSSDGAVTCPHCGQTCEPEVEASPLVSVARLANLAEVGYFDAVLTENGVATTIRQCEDFDAIRGIWTQSFVIQVSADEADRAATLIESELRQTATTDDEAESSPAPSLESKAPVATIQFIHIALLLAVAGLAYGASVWVPGLIDRGPGAGQSLWQAVAESNRPLATNSLAGQPRRVLYLDRATRRVVLEEDLDGDGRLDRRREFADDRLVEDRRL